MSPFTLTALLLLAVITTAVVPYIIGKLALNRKVAENYLLKNRGLFDYAADDPEAPWNRIRESGLSIGDSPESPELRAAREKFRPETEAVDIYKKLAAEVYEPAVRAQATKDARTNGWRAPDYGESYPPSFGKRKPAVFLSPRQLERVNVSRRAAGRTWLNMAGFANAVACAWGGHKPMLVQQPKDAAEWLAYLIVYQCFTIHHVSDWADVGTGLTITPDMPYNGQESEVPGAGASGEWQDPDVPTATAAAAIAAGEAILTGGDPLRDGPTTWHDPVGALGPVDPLSDPESFKGSSDHDPAQNRPVEPATAGDGYHFVKDPLRDNPVVGFMSEKRANDILDKERLRRLRVGEWARNQDTV